MRSLAKRIGETIYNADWRARHLAKRIGEEEEDEEEAEEQTALMKSSNPHLAGGEICTLLLCLPFPLSLNFQLSQRICWASGIAIPGLDSAQHPFANNCI